MLFAADADRVSSRALIGGRRGRVHGRGADAPVPPVLVGLVTSAYGLFVLAKTAGMLALVGIRRVQSAAAHAAA